MNLLLTNRCGKGCTFCFTDPKKIDEMSLEEIRLIVDFCGREVSLLGGEPTDYRHFEQIFKELKSRGCGINLITNLLFKPQTAYFIAERIYKDFSILANGGELDVGDRIEKFSANWKILKKNDFEPTFSLTIDHRRDEKYYSSYIDFVQKAIDPKIVRLSMMYPGREQKSPFFINNFQLGNLFSTIVEKLISLRIQTAFDCYIYPCMFSDFEKFKRYTNGFSFCGGARDFTSNGEVLFCWPCEHIRVKWRDYKNYEEMGEALIKKYNDFRNKQAVPSECLKCKHHKIICGGPCGAFFQR